MSAPFLSFALLLAAVGATEVPPPPTRWVTDEAGFLSPSTRQALDAKLQSFERQTGHQVLVWIGSSTRGVPIEDFAVRAFGAWKVGRKGLDDGLVLFVMADDRTMRIEVGYGLEDKVPDASASRIIREILVPGFRAGDRDGAVSRAVDSLLGVIQSEAALPARLPVGQPTAGQLVVLALAGLGLLILFITNPALAVHLLLVLASGRRRGGLGGLGGGGGFRGGGGRSGGGGASGSW